MDSQQFKQISFFRFIALNTDCKLKFNSTRRYHPFYITDSPEGGFGQLHELQQKKQKVFAGVAYDASNYPYPTAAGRYCEYVHKRTDQSAKTETFKEFFNTLRLDCENGEPTTLVWHVDEDTPDLVYYQVRRDCSCSVTIFL